MGEGFFVACPSCDTLKHVLGQQATRAECCENCGHPLFLGKPVALDTNRFAVHAERADLPVLVDFWTPWCGPWWLMAPVFERAAAELEPAVRLATVDADTSPDLADRFRIDSVPTLLLVVRGKEIARDSGTMPFPVLIDWVRRALVKKNKKLT